MGDFYQNGRVTTLHNFRTRTLDDLESSLEGFVRRCPMTLILPSLFAGNIYTAGEEFLANPMQTPFVPIWKRIMSAEPGFIEQLFETVQLDNTWIWLSTLLKLPATFYVWDDDPFVVCP